MSRTIGKRYIASFAKALNIDMSNAIGEDLYTGDIVTRMDLIAEIGREIGMDIETVGSECDGSVRLVRSNGKEYK